MPAPGIKGYAYPSGSVTDGGSIDGTVSIGAAFDDNRGHAIAYFGYRKVKPDPSARRDYSACGLQNTGATFRCGGSANLRSRQRIRVQQCGGSHRGASSTFALRAERTIVPGAQNLYNFAPTNYFQRPDERYTAGAFADYEISPAVHPYMEFMFMNDHTLAQIAPSGDFGNTFTINCDNPFCRPRRAASSARPRT